MLGQDGTQTLAVYMQTHTTTGSQPLKDEAYTTDINTDTQRYDEATQNYSLSVPMPNTMLQNKMN